MSSQQRAKKAGWGSLLSGAVSGIESRLDSILAEENALAAQKAADANKRGSGASSVSHTPSTRRSKPSTGTSRSLTPQPSPSTLAPPRPSTESSVSDSAIISASASARTDPGPSPELTPRPSTDIPGGEAKLSIEEPHRSIEQHQFTTHRPSDGKVDLEASHLTPNSAEELQSELQQAKSDYENVQLRRQEEVHDYLERIDALQAKLQYLTKEVSEAARKAAAESGRDQLEKRLAERDEKVALLLEEGTKLSKSEVSQLGIIRNLRAEKAESANSVANARRKLALQESVIKDKVFEISQLEGERTAATVRAAKASALENEVASLRSALADKDSQILQLEKAAEEVNTRANDEARHRTAEALDIERATSSSLRDETSKLKNELASSNDQSKLELNRAREQTKAAQERHQAAETALRTEISTLEGRLEIARSQSEESTATTGSESTAKLLRQVEVLQRQYSLASENWQGIEASLQSRITALEKERDESSKNENEARRKAREAGSSSRRLQDQLDDALQRMRLFEHEVDEQKANADSVHKRADDFERRLQEAKERFESEKQSLSANFNAKLEEERLRWQSQLHNPEPSIFSGSPQHSHPRKMSTLDLPALSMSRSNRRSTPNLTLASAHRDSHSRRSSMLPRTRGPENITSPVHDSGPPTPFFGNGDHVPPTPSLPTVTTDHDGDDDFEEISSPRRTINDMVSASTAAAGPSVQLVERMSASVRRLETEKAANKEELARLSGQRDEARKEIVSLMQEVEAKRDLDSKIEKLEGELAETRRRYAASLEMLGEKEEKVDELQADVTDLKKIYRELVERTVK
ncbi:MAG: hypothetical protein Q9162_007076 [Coniocarpon cinnabarinum]